MSKFTMYAIVVLTVIVALVALTTSIVTLTTLQEIQNTHCVLKAKEDIVDRTRVNQEHSMQMGQIAVQAGHRANVLDQQIEELGDAIVKSFEDRNKLRMTLASQHMTLRAQGAYINQLRDFIRANKLTVPHPDLSRIKPPTKPRVRRQSPDKEA